ncbi:MAG: hypothetical protein AAF571_06775 [Verrucomicrobiota bacterium]
MNPQMTARIRAGEFATVVIEEETRFTGYIATDPEQPDALRMDGYILSETGNLQQISIALQPDEIYHITFLPEPPEFIAEDGTSILMEKGFFPGL